MSSTSLKLKCLRYVIWPFRHGLGSLESVRGRFHIYFARRVQFAVLARCITDMWRLEVFLVAQLNNIKHETITFFTSSMGLLPVQSNKARFRETNRPYATATCAQHRMMKDRMTCIFVPHPLFSMHAPWHCLSDDTILQILWSEVFPLTLV